MANVTALPACRDAATLRERRRHVISLLMPLSMPPFRQMLQMLDDTPRLRLLTLPPPDVALLRCRRFTPLVDGYATLRRVSPPASLDDIFSDVCFTGLR